VLNRRRSNAIEAVGVSIRMPAPNLRREERNVKRKRRSGKREGPRGGEEVGEVGGRGRRDRQKERREGEEEGGTDRRRGGREKRKERGVEGSDQLIALVTHISFQKMSLEPNVIRW